jgi:pantoate--beta-alanine ligase
MNPILITTITGLRRQLAARRQQGQTVGFVPTMGALHAGHGALMEQARRECGCVAVSVFVNPIQFDRREDYEAYLIDLPKDVEFCGARGVDVVFAPPVEEMYPSACATSVEVAGVSEGLCGAFRPGHFKGVATVVAKLFNIVGPCRAYFGEKDAQQLAVIERMAADLNIPVEVVPVAIMREADGLAMSSRNRRLTPEERAVAPRLFQALEAARASLLRDGGAAGAKEAALAALAPFSQFRVEYLEIVDAASMAPVERMDGPVRVAAAAWLGTTRLIDNVLCK